MFIRPIDLLSDAKGVYGIGINEADICKDRDYSPPPQLNHLILRPDIIRELPLLLSIDRGGKPTNRVTLLHTLPIRYFTESLERRLHKFMVDQALARNPRFHELQEEIEQKGGEDNELWWRGERGKLYRKIKWGQHKQQLIYLNHKLKRLLSEAADPDALKLARRFHPLTRENIYRAAATSSRALQLIDVFPVLGQFIYCPEEADDWVIKASEAANMIERGVKLNQIASFLEIPMWARKLQPAVAHWFCYMREELHHYLPEKTWEQRIWLRAFMSRRNTDPDFAYWIARNVLKVGNRIPPVLNFLSDMNDWVMEAKREQPRCITRPFCPDMSVETVRTENEHWHEAIAKCDTAKSAYKIPVPWYPAGQANGYRIVPLDSAEELWKEGRAMHHCVGSYDYRVAAGGCYIYSVRQGDNRVATVELVRKDGKVVPQQIRAACNDEPPKEVKVAVRKWISELKAA